MTRTGKAIEALRTRLGDSQRAFAKRLKTTITTISRYENGHIEPSEQALKKLADIANSNNQPDLGEIFNSQRMAAGIARKENLRSPGTQRRVNLESLKYWSAYLRQTAEYIKHVSPETAREYLLEHLRHAAWVMRHVRDEIEIPIAEPYSLTRIEEDKQLLQLQPKSTSTSKPSPKPERE